MTSQQSGSSRPQPIVGGKDFHVYYFSQLYKLPVCVGSIGNRIGKVRDLVFKVAEPYPEAIGIYMYYGWGKPTQFVPWDKVQRIEGNAIFVAAPEGECYPPFVDQPGWIMVDDHLMGRTILDTDGRQVEVVNDVHLIESKGRMLLIHVDTSFNGFLRRWGVGSLAHAREKLISWKYVQPLSVEDAVSTDKVSLSLTRKQVKELPSEDLADVLEELSGEEQEALFSALDSEKAAEALIEAEPRTQRQLIADLRKERARTILMEMSTPQISDLMSVLPHDEVVKLMALLPEAEQQKITSLLSDREATARTMMSSQFLAVTREIKVGDLIATIRKSGLDHAAISYIYIIAAPEERGLIGVVDVRDLLLADDGVRLGEIMASPVVSADEDDMRDDLGEMFAKYHYRMVPVVDRQDHLLGVIHYNDIMKGLVTRARM